jgi:hypothetical protein
VRRPKRALLAFLFLGTALACASSKGAGPGGQKLECPAEPTLGAKPMREAMVGEETGEVWGTKVLYADETTRQQFALQVAGGKVLHEGAPYDTGGKLAIFVLSPEGELFASTRAKKGHFHHSTFLAGQPVAAAGELLVTQGVLEVVTDRSGHYRPGFDQTASFLCWLAASGVDLSTVELRLQDGRTMPADGLETR